LTNKLFRDEERKRKEKMRKLIVILSVLPGGFFLATAMMLFVGCARLQYERVGIKVSGYTTDPIGAMYVASQSIVNEGDSTSRNYALERCADDPSKCTAAALSQMNRSGMYGVGLDNSYAYTMAGINAAAAYTGGGLPLVGANGAKGNDLREVRKDIVRLKKSQEEVIGAIGEMAKGKK
jgi:hypothetical protein